MISHDHLHEITSAANELIYIQKQRKELAIKEEELVRIIANLTALNFKDE